MPKSKKHKKLKEMVKMCGKGGPGIKKEDNLSPVDNKRLNEVEFNIKKQAIPTIKGTRRAPNGWEHHSFSPEQMKNPAFRKKLRQLQEKLKITEIT